ncbi:MAG: UDP-2,3-diacylglucosamine diphosphatase [Betaproteobacteria bacterium RIFCSPLOWO2_02_FULL_63_19]|nr:MAG: UDP-2,3-diacylglucosamine diphosphatase [Betaproteobacteria bacterium RIFCSPLOWO2_02_FULL_63_19]
MILFVSDLHLCSSRPETCRIFFDFLAGPARGADALYILGDLFEYWAGDDDIDDPFNASIVSALRGCAGDTPVYLMHGNRDFLLGERFALAAGVQLIDDPALIDCCGTPTLLTHGDALCTDDEDYMRFRAEVRSARWIEAFLATPLTERKMRIEALRRESEAQKKRKPMRTMDVNDLAVQALLRSHAYPRLVHGHTHRPARHEHVVDAHRCERWVLADWYASGSYLSSIGSETVSVALPNKSS